MAKKAIKKPVAKPIEQKTIVLTIAEIEALKTAIEIGSAGMVQAEFKKTLQGILQKL